MSLDYATRPRHWQNKPGSRSFIERGCMYVLMPSEDVDMIVTATDFDGLSDGDALTLNANTQMVPRVSVQFTIVDADGSSDGDFTFDITGVNHLGEAITERLTFSYEQGVSSDTFTTQAAWSRLDSITLVSKPAGATAAGDSVSVGYSYQGGPLDRPRVGVPRFSSIPSNAVLFKAFDAAGGVPASVAFQAATWNETYATVTPGFLQSTGMALAVMWDPTFEE